MCSSQGTVSSNRSNCMEETDRGAVSGLFEVSIPLQIQFQVWRWGEQPHCRFRLRLYHFPSLCWKICLLLALVLEMLTVMVFSMWSCFHSKEDMYVSRSFWVFVSQQALILHCMLPPYPCNLVLQVHHHAVPLFFDATCPLPDQMLPRTQKAYVSAGTLMPPGIPGLSISCLSVPWCLLIPPRNLWSPDIVEPLKYQQPWTRPQGCWTGVAFAFALTSVIKTLGAETLSCPDWDAFLFPKSNGHIDACQSM